jgi:hypothetical protein
MGMWIHATLNSLPSQEQNILQQTVQFCPLFLLAFLLAGNCAALSRAVASWGVNFGAIHKTKCFKVSNVHGVGRIPDWGWFS